MCYNGNSLLIKGYFMRVYNVLPVRSNVNNVIPSSVGSTRANASDSSFGWLLKPRQAELVKKYLPKERRQMYDAEFMDAFNAPNPKVATDNVMIRALREARKCRFLVFLAKIPACFGGFVGTV